MLLFFRPAWRKNIIFLLLIHITLLVTGCVSYTGLRPKACLTQLAVANKSSWSFLPQCRWWEAFHDPELNQLIAFALCHSPNIKIAKDRLCAADFIARQAGASLWPNLHTENFLAREHFTGNTIIPPPFAGHTENVGLLFLTFNYSLDFWGANRNNWAAALSDAQAKCAESKAAELTLTTAVAKTYFQWESNLAQMKLCDALLQQQQMLLKIIQKRAASGLSSLIPVNQADIDVQGTLVKYYNFKVAAEVARHQLLALLGSCDDNLLLVPKGLTTYKQCLKLPCMVPVALLARLPHLAALRWRVDTAAHHAEVTKAAFYPNINLIANASLQSIGLGKLFQGSSKDLNIIPFLSLPIFDAGRLRAKLGADYAEYDQAVDEYNQAVVEAIREAADKLSILKGVTFQRNAQLTALVRAQNNYHLTCSRYLHGIDDYLTVIKVQLVLSEKELAQTQIETEYLQAVINTIKALGGSCPGIGP